MTARMAAPAETPATISMTRHELTQTPPDVLDVVRERFNRWYSPAPWHEAWHCPVCADGHDPYGPHGRYGQTEVNPEGPRCSRHFGQRLVPFWSGERALAYQAAIAAQPQSWLLVARDEAGQLVGWVWGYRIADDLAARLEVRPGSLYVDVLGTLEEHRHRPVSDTGLRMTSYLFCHFNDELVNGQLMAPGFGPAPRHLTFRTHAQARHLTRLLPGGCHTEPDWHDREDQERVFWVMRG